MASCSPVNTDTESTTTTTTARAASPDPADVSVHSDEEAPPVPRLVTLERHSDVGFGFVAGSEKPVVVRFVKEGKRISIKQVLIVRCGNFSLASFAPLPTSLCFESICTWLMQLRQVMSHSCIAQCTCRCDTSFFTLLDVGFFLWPAFLSGTSVAIAKCYNLLV